MGKDFTATIVKKGERADEWQEILGSTTINIKSPLPSYANLPGKPKELIYELDLALLTAGQRYRLVTHLSTKFNMWADEVEAHLDRVGCPILAEDVTITVHNPQRWF